MNWLATMMWALPPFTVQFMDADSLSLWTGLTAIAKLAGLWVDRAENINGNYAISDKPLTEQEWVEKHVRKPSL